MGYYNNKGQRDGSRRSYDPPGGYGLLDGWTESSGRRRIKERREYDAGYTNGKRGR